MNLIHINTVRKHVIIDDQHHLTWDLVSELGLSPRALYWGHVAPNKTKWQKNNIDEGGKREVSYITETELSLLNGSVSSIRAAWLSGPGSVTDSKHSLLAYYNSLSRPVRRVFLDILPGVQWAIENDDFMLARDRIASINIQSLPANQRNVVDKAKKNILAFFKSKGIDADEESPDWVDPN